MTALTNPTAANTTPPDLRSMRGEIKTGAQWLELARLGALPRSVLSRSQSLNIYRRYRLTVPNGGKGYLRAVPDKPACIGDVHYGWEWRIMLANGHAPEDIARQLDKSRPVYCLSNRRYRLGRNTYGQHYLENADKDQPKKG